MHAHEQVNNEQTLDLASHIQKANVIVTCAQ
jgi:hypothetical protein